MKASIIKAEPIKFYKEKFKAIAAFPGGVKKHSVKNLPRTIRTGQSRRQGPGTPHQTKGNRTRKYNEELW